VKAFLNIFYYIVAGGALTLGLLLVLLQTSVIPGFQVLIVQSGSMEPAIHTGSVVVLQAKAKYEEGQVVTFGAVATKVPTTHRIVGSKIEAGELVFVTKGDANDEVDVELLKPENIRGLVLFSIPVLGYLLDFAKQPMGFALLIGLPAALIIFEEVGKIVEAVKRERRKEEELALDGNPFEPPKT
jgi:signal peptidase